MKHIFISYAHVDSDFAEIIRSKLEEEELKTWLAHDGLKAGEDWRQGIDEAIRDSFAVIVLISPESDQSKYVTYEWAFAYGIGIQIVPILYRSLSVDIKIHPRLEGLQYEDFTHKTVRPWDRLIQRLKEIEQNVRAKNDSDPQVLEAIKALNGWKQTEKIEAAHFLGQVKAISAVTSLIRALSHPNYDVQHSSIVALGQIGDHASVEALIPLLQSTNYKLREITVIALGDIGDQGVIPHLINLLNDPSCEVRLVTIQVFGRMKSKDAILAIVKMLSKFNDFSCEESDEDLEYYIDHEENILEAAVSALANLLDKSTFALLADLAIKADAKILAKVLNMLRQINDVEITNFLFKTLAHWDGTIRQLSLQLLGSFKEFAQISQILELLNDDNFEIRSGAVDKLYDIANINGLLTGLATYPSKAYWQIATKLEKIVTLEHRPILIETLSSQSVRSRGCVVELLSNRPEFDICEELLFLVDDDTAFVRGMTVRALGRLGYTQATSLLKEKLNDSEPVFSNSESRVQDYAVISLAQLGDKTIVEQLINLLSSSVLDLQSNAAKLLGKLKDPTAITALIKASGDEYSTKSLEAWEALQEFPSKDVATQAMKLLGGKDWNTTLAAIDVLTLIPEEVTKQKLFKMTREKNLIKQSAAILALGELGEQDILSDILNLATNHEQWRVKDRAIRIIGNIGNKSHLPFLITIFQNDTDCDLRAAAASSIGKLGDESVVAILIDAFEDDCSTYYGSSIGWVISSALKLIGTPVAIAAANSWETSNGGIPF